jgi:hypothetical protein
LDAARSFENVREMSQYVDVVLVAFIFLALVALLVMIIVAGVSARDQINAINGQLAAAFTAVFLAFNGLVGSTVTTFANFANTVIPMLDSIAGQVGDGLATVAEQLGLTLVDQVNKLSSGITQLGGRLTRLVAEAQQSINSSGDSTVASVFNVTTSIVRTLTGFLVNAQAFIIMLISQFVSIAISTVIGFIQTILDTLVETFDTILGGLSEGVNAVLTGIFFLESAYSSVLETLKGVGVQIQSGLTAAGQKLVQAYDTVAGFVRGVFNWFMCNILLPLCRALVVVDCSSIRSAGQC